MKPWTLLLSAPLALTLVVASPALARGPEGDPPGQGQRQAPPMQGHMERQQGNKVTWVTRDRFTDDEIRIIRAYYRDGDRDQRGVHDWDPPPGIQRNLARGKPLPPGIAKHGPPRDLSNRLPSRPGYERVVVGNDVLLVVAATGVIVDVMKDVFTRR
ncbi:MAG: anti-virulence regulator CigR family protein [Rhodospirillum sp.]|nr:anti-virulence regulator CigR family protein [Rhodospirillum sp.]MCF8489663.1 anti-virulence regulator CigR family protein [Rhodospirillum sp.]MCF8502938.1 anti-virulence regulator CigR family protein [Rhodospirillum sp.]